MMLAAFRIAIAGMAGIAGLRARHHQSVTALLKGLMSSASAYGDVQAFQILFLVAVAACAVLALVALIGFGGYVLFGNSFHVVLPAWRSVREAERSSRAAIETAEHLRTVTRSILRKAGRSSAPDWS